MMKAKGYFTIDKWESNGSLGGQFEHLAFEVKNNLRCGAETLLTIQWQAGEMDRPLQDKWYGFRFITEGYSVDRLAEGVKVARAIERRLDALPGFSTSPKDVYDALVKAGYVHVVYDTRCGRRVPIDKVAPVENTAWIAKFFDGGRAGPMFAACREDAQRVFFDEINKSIANDMTTSSGDWITQDEFEDWISKGKPVEMVNADEQAPNIDALSIEAMIA
jgi:hypothetical protein